MLIMITRVFILGVRPGTYLSAETPIVHSLYGYPVARIVCMGVHRYLVLGILAFGNVYNKITPVIYSFSLCLRNWCAY